MDSNEIKLITPQEYTELIEHFDEPFIGNFLKGKYLCKTESGAWIAVDNSTGDAWTEEFSTEEKARCWLDASQYDKQDVEQLFASMKKEETK